MDVMKRRFSGLIMLGLGVGVRESMFFTKTFIGSSLSDFVCNLHENYFSSSCCEKGNIKLHGGSGRQ